MKNPFQHGLYLKISYTSMKKVDVHTKMLTNGTWVALDEPEQVVLESGMYVRILISGTTILFKMSVFRR